MSRDQLKNAVRKRCMLSGESYQSVLRQVVAGDISLSVTHDSSETEWLESDVFRALSNRANYRKTPFGVRRYMYGAKNTPVVELDTFELGLGTLRSRMYAALEDLLPYAETPYGATVFGIEGLEVRSTRGRELTVGLSARPRAALVIRSSGETWDNAIGRREAEVRGQGYYPAWEAAAARWAAQPRSSDHSSGLSHLGSLLLRTTGAVRRLTPAYCGNSWFDTDRITVELLISRSHRSGHHHEYLRALTTAFPELTFELISCACARFSGSCIEHLRSRYAGTSVVELRFSRGGVEEPDTDERRLLASGLTTHRAKEVFDAYRCRCLFI